MKRLEEEIHQKKFSSEQEKVLVNIIFTHNYFLYRLEEVFKSFDVTLQQYNILRILKGQYPNPICLNEIKNRMLDRNSDVSRIVERMHKKLLLTRKINKKNRRSVEVVITEHGIDKLKFIEPYLKEFFTNSLSHLSKSELKQLNELLDKLRSK